MSLPVFTESDAEFYDDGRRRLWLARGWGDLTHRLLIIGLNPSFAGAVKNDHTITVEVGFATRWGYGAFDKLNLFDWIDTNPKALARAEEPSGSRNNGLLLELARRDAQILCAWGAGGALGGRAAYVLNMLWHHRDKMICLGRTTEGYPKHTSRLSYETPLVPMVHNDHPDSKDGL
jgi:hypothetical protein